MSRRLRSLVACLSLLSGTFAAQAQANLIHGISAGIGLARQASNSNKNGTDYTVSNLSYRGQEFSVKRTPAEQNTGPAAGHIGMLEAELEKCYKALVADSTSSVCSENQKVNIKSLQALISRAQPGWNQKPYRAEAAFYAAEDARRQRVAGTPAPTK
ncbi:hypothetical protein ACFQT0_06565 [Hymenobacter humi]|uniref:Uncharacterized protein n=1 Tax=Hymenobacter humi TaxID=1411620 RepID=A0ABW2U268_9BACT